MANFKWPLGAKVRDKVSGFTGIVVGRHEWLYGCLCYSVRPQELHDGKPIERQSFDEDTLELLEQALSDDVTPGGGPAPKVSRPHE
jgi:hypothetical protein